MRFFPSIVVLVISFATFQLAYGDANEVDVPNAFVVRSKQDRELAEFEETENDEELDNGAKYRWLAPALYDELEKRGKKVKSGRKNKPTQAANATQPTEEEEGEEIKKKPKKNRGPKNKDKKNKGKNQKSPAEIKYTEEDEKLWFDHLGCYKDRGFEPSKRAIKRLYYNNRKRITWSDDWSWVMGVIMKCAHAAQAEAFPCFGIQFYGECWGSYNACQTYNRYGNSSKSIHGVGLHWTNCVYRARCGSVYGCCPDGSMPAKGPNDEGCPECTTAVDLVFVVDSSGSIGRDNFEMVRQMLRKCIRFFSVSAKHARIGVIRYATTAQTIFTLRRSQKLGFRKLDQKIKNMGYTKGQTKTGKGLQMANRMLRSSRRKLDGKFVKHHQVVIAVTDGLTDDDDLLRFNTSSSALRNTAHVVAVGVAGKGYDNKKKAQQRIELGQIASDDQAVFYEPTFKQLVDHVHPIARQACPLFNKKSKPA